MAEIVYDMEWLKSATVQDLMNTLKLGEPTVSIVNAVLRTPEGQKISREMLEDPNYVPVSKRPPDPEEAAQIALDIERAEAQAAADALALASTPPVVVPPPPAGPTPEELAAEDAELKTAGITVHRNEQGQVVKIIQAYQVTDENGRPIGRPTHLESKNWAEHAAKQRNAHENGVRYAERLKKTRVQNSEVQSQQVKAQQQAQVSETEAQAAIAEAVKENTPVKLTQALRKVSKAERDAEIAAKQAEKAGEVVGATWIEFHKDDFWPCVANTKLIGDWLQANKLDFTFDNLESAYTALETQLAVKPTPVVEIPVAPAPNVPVAAPVVPPVAQPPIPVAAPVTPAIVSTPAPQPSTPVVLAPETPSAAAPNAQPAARRPGVNGGLVPGASSAVRPVEQQQPATTTRAELMKEIRKMSGSELRAAMKRSEFRARCEANGIPFASLKN